MGVTEFSNEVVNVTQVNEGMSTPLTLLPDSQYQDIKEYFARPRLVTKFNAATTRSVLYGFDVYDWVKDFWPAAAVNRLNGVFAYRCTARLTLTLASTPFQQGLVTVGFQYGGNSTGFTVARQNFPPLSTNVPHARLNFSDTTIAELDIPFVYPYDFIEFANGTAGGGDNFRYPYGNLGVVQQMAYVTLPATTAPRLSLYVSLVDMELFGAVPVALNAVIPQSGLATMNAEARKHKYASRALTGVSSAANVVSKVAGTLGVPGVGAMASTVSWMTEKLAGTAKSFGYSKPIVEAAPIRTEQNVSGTSTNIDNADTAIVVGPYSSNRLDVTPVDGPDIDQMSMSYILSQWNQIFVGAVNTSYTDGTFVYATRCCPTNFWFRTNTGVPGGNLALPASTTLTTNSIYPSSLCYFGSMFRYFRGGLKFRFTFAKTKFHAGRLVASFVPSTEDFGGVGLGTSIVPLPEVTAGVGLQPFTSSAIFDLKDDSVFEFCVPYVCCRPHLSTSGSFGGISLAVLDVLRTTGETSTAINFMVEVCAADDFEFSNYVGTGLVPAVGNSINSRVVALQSGLNDISTIHDKTFEVVHQTMGEKISSAKEIIMIPTYTQAFVNAGENLVTDLPLWGYYPALPVITPPFSNTTIYRFVTSPGNLVGSCYAFLSGGTTHRVFSDSNDFRAFIRQQPLDGGETPATVSDPRYRGPTTLARHYTSGATYTALHAKAPSYQKTKIVPRDQFGFYSTTVNFDPRGSSTVRSNLYVNSIYQLNVSNKKGTGSTVMYYYYGMSASDDAKCHHYIGPPPVIISGSTSTSPISETSQSLL